MVRRKSRRSNRWAGWSKIQPRGRQRRSMRRKCGKKCFLGPKGDPTGFPICAVYGDTISCKPNDKGLWAAYLRARQLSGTKRRGRRHGSRTYTRIASTARRMLEDRGRWRGRGGSGAEPSGASTTTVHLNSHDLANHTDTSGNSIDHGTSLEHHASLSANGVNTSGKIHT